MADSDAAPSAPVAGEQPETATEGATPAEHAAGSHGHGHHAFDFQGALAHHNMPYPAWEPVHGKPLIIFDEAHYAAKAFDELSDGPDYANADPSATQVAWAHDFIGAHAKYGSLDEHALAKAMVVAEQRAVFATFPRPLAWFNQQTFFGTVALILMSLLLLVVARRKPSQVVPKGKLQHAIEAFVLFVRDDIVRPNIHHGDHWVPHFCALFLAILSFNLMGMVPGTGTASGNAGVTSGFAITTFICMLLFGIKEQGFAHFWINLSPVKFSWNPVDLVLWPLLWVIELMGLFIRPIALSIRLFANMFAGHAVLLSFSALGMIVFAAQPKMLGLAAGLGAIGWVVTVALFFLELLVAFIQAYVFTLLSAIFIGSAMHPDH